MLNINFWVDTATRDDVIDVSMVTGFSHYERIYTFQNIFVCSSVEKNCKNLILLRNIRMHNIFHPTKFQGQRLKVKVNIDLQVKITYDAVSQDVMQIETSGYVHNIIIG